jgi:hypothetical protein
VSDIRNVLRRAAAVAPDAMRDADGAMRRGSRLRWYRRAQVGLSVALVAVLVALVVPSLMPIRESERISPVGPGSHERQPPTPRATLAAEEVTFSDGADDAYRVPGYPERPPASQRPSADLSDPSADILQAGFANAKGNANRRSYTATMTVTGPVDPAYSYVVYGEFGADCQLFHFLTPGIRSFANAFCGSGDTRRLIGRISGSPVVQNGTTLTASYTYMTKRLPPELAADTQLGPLAAFSCVSGLEGLGCHVQDQLDVAQSPLTATSTI